MNISYNWLKEYVDCDLDALQVAHALTSTGLEVGAIEEIQTIKGGLKDLYVGQVLSCEAHPNSDHLHVTTVDLGRNEPVQIVCGAPNVATGQKVIVADIGCILYDGDKKFVIKKSKLRGVESMGMICAEDEIGIGSDHSGIIVLPSDAPVGMPASEYYHIQNDSLIEIDVTANRSDALSHWGVARDLYAWLKRNGYNSSLHRPDCASWKPDNYDLPIKVTIENVDACLRYACVSLTNCNVKESPSWLQDKLRAIGLRPINNIVDITNYIMMAYGQPMHCFDADMVKGRHIVVRTQPEGTKFVTLDGVEHILGPYDLSICNEEEPMCIAGIFGGKGSGTYENTKNVVLESALFHPLWIRKSAKRHGLSTDSSYRFERGVDPDNTIYALKQAAILCKQLSGGQISMDICDVYPSPKPKTRVEISFDYIKKLIGKDLTRDVIKDICQSLEMEILSDDGEVMLLEIPKYRTDVQRPCDIAEDILRIYGYNNIETPQQIRCSLTIKGLQDRKHRMTETISEQLVGCGFCEIMNNSLTRSAYYKDLNVYPEKHCVKIVNPISQDLNVMRQTLLFGGLETIKHNINRRNNNLRLFEFGNVYHFDPQKFDPNDHLKAYSEETMLALWLTGKQIEDSWIHPDEEASYHHLNAYVNNILSRCGLEQSVLIHQKSDNNIFSQGISATTHDKKNVFDIGILNKNITKVIDCEQPIYYVEIHWTLLMALTAKSKTLYKQYSEYPSVSRDLSLLIDNDITFAQIEDIARKTEKTLLKSITLFDVYQGDKLPQGKKSYAVKFILQDDNKTLTDKQIDAVMNKLTANFREKIGAELR